MSNPILHLAAIQLVVFLAGWIVAHQNNETAPFMVLCGVGAVCWLAVCGAYAIFLAVGL